jgi:hypothetical protein
MADLGIISRPPVVKPQQQPEKEMLLRKEAANYLQSKGCRITAKTLTNMASNNNAGNGPPYTRDGWKTVLYARKDLDAWLTKRRTYIGSR